MGGRQLGGKLTKIGRSGWEPSNPPPTPVPTTFLERAIWVVGTGVGGKPGGTAGGVSLRYHLPLGEKSFFFLLHYSCRNSPWRRAPHGPAVARAMVFSTTHNTCALARQGWRAGGSKFEEIRTQPQSGVFHPCACVAVSTTRGGGGLNIGEVGSGPDPVPTARPPRSQKTQGVAIANGSLGRRGQARREGAQLD